MKVLPANTADAHRALGPEHDVASALSRVEQRQITSDYTFRNEGKMYQIARRCIQPGMRGSTLRVEMRLDGSMAVRFGDKWLEVSECQVPPKRVAPDKNRSAAASSKPQATTAQRTKPWRDSNQRLFQGGPGVYAAAAVNRTRTRDTLD